jgi:hypothetical protein
LCKPAFTPKARMTAAAATADTVTDKYCRSEGVARFVDSDLGQMCN